ncbi:TPA: hypothetical protein N0F65_011624 [Lagenidium giganteum]|uniref:PX domain-containing protein n=1 Tax=Lagenidium giganteum TaxID=4803 RepID=A0AAV2ZBE5_9STRA|nr:TPA: hypothetical protein N0F65_011624 [Lagenidium giganteum]
MAQRMSCMEADCHAGSFSNISCGPGSMAPKVLVGIIRTDEVNGKTVYVMRCMLIASELEWIVQRRYSEFLDIRTDLAHFFARTMVNQCFGCRWFSQTLNSFDFPRKHMLSSRDLDVVRHRKQQLDSFARLLAAHTFSSIPKCVKCSKGPFTRVRDFFLKAATLPAHLTYRQIRMALVPEAFSAISDPSKSKIEFRRGHGILRVLQVETPVNSKRDEYEQAMQEYAIQQALKRKMPSLASLLDEPRKDGENERDKHNEGRNDDDDDESPFIILGDAEDDDTDMIDEGFELDMAGIEVGLDMTGVACDDDPKDKFLAPKHAQPSEIVDMESMAHRLEPLTGRPSQNLRQPSNSQVTSATPRCVKQEYLGAVTLVHFSVDGSLLYVGVGATLYAYDTRTSELDATYQVMPRGILHGVDFVETVNGLTNVAVFHGQKRVVCVHNLPQTPAAARAQQQLTSLSKVKSFSDWVYDVQVLARETSAEPLVAVGLAHNFIQIWQPTTDTILRTVQCSERCILYALSFYGRSLSELMVASGTVFQQILLWSADKDTNSADAVATTAQTLHSHDGVIFKLTWSNDGSMLASVSDDRTVQLWSNRNKSEFPAKTTDLPDKQTARAQLLATEYSSVFRSWGHSARLWDVQFCAFGLATTSEESVCKVWDFTGRCIATLQGHMGRHVWRVGVHPNGNMLATGGGDGAVKLWSLPHQIACTESEIDSCRSIPVITSKREGVAHNPCVRDIVIDRNRQQQAFVAMENGAIVSVNLETNTSDELAVITMDANRSNANLSCFSSDSTGRYLLVGDSNGTLSVLDATSAKVLYSWRAHKARIIKIWWNAADESLFSSSVDGMLQEWKLELAGTESSHGLVAAFKGPAKSAVASLCVADRDGWRVVVCGDGRGSVFLFKRSIVDAAADAMDTTNDSTEAPIDVVFVDRSAHGRDHVAAIVVEGDRVYSGGHDGCIASYQLVVAGANAHLQWIGRQSIKGISTIKQLWRNERNEMLVLGFHATHAILYNWTTQYRLFHLECGGWRRPHALLTQAPSHSALPGHVFLFTGPVAKKEAAVVQVHTYHSTDAISNCSIHDLYHGRMTTSIRQLGKNSEMIATAAEDNTVKIHVRVQDSTAGVARWRAVATGMAHTTAVRTLTSFTRAVHDGKSQHVLVSGGGKQHVNVWTVDPADATLRHVCGHLKENVSQDHRILGVETFAISSDVYLVTACNSEGAIQLLLLDLGLATVTELGECSSSKKPILASGALQTDQVALLAVGSTDGMINVWNLDTIISTIREAITASTRPELGDLLELLAPAHSYLAHDMGANCLCVTLDAASNSFSIVSGGDDQSILFRQLSLSTMEVLHETRVVNASGSAIKTIESDGRAVFSAGYDQRVSMWDMVGSNAQRQLEWQCGAFVECADIADLAFSNEDNTNNYRVIVVGQGLSQMVFTRDHQ